MRWLLRPLVLVPLLLALAAGAFVLSLPARAPGKPTPLSVEDRDREIVWLYQATTQGTWERFVAAVRRAGERLRQDHPELSVEVGQAAFPQQTTAVPQVAIRCPAVGGRLVFRWYKLTSDWKARDWVQTLVNRDPPPLAIIGGSSSDAARDLATQLEQATQQIPEASRPLLLLTTATADAVRDGDEDGRDLVDLYPGRTFRFCFTNRQMATAVTRFVWSKPDLRPDADPVHLVLWEDDSYSGDLVNGFLKALRYRVLDAELADWAYLSGCLLHGGVPGLAGGPLPVDRLGPTASTFRLALNSSPRFIPSSVGPFQTPNRFEAQAAGELLEEMSKFPSQRRPLLVVTGQSAPSRRFLRAVARTAPDLSRRIVVATGDAIAFNTVYRDGPLAWPIQDLPFALVFFCHHNPTDVNAGFKAASEGGAPTTASTGTEDVLLYSDIVEALVQAVYAVPGDWPDADELGRRVGALMQDEGRVVAGDQGVPLFGPNGNRRGSTGEHVVVLRPEVIRGRVLPRAEIEVWAWRSHPDGTRFWETCGPPLRVNYDRGSGGLRDDDR